MKQAVMAGNFLRMRQARNVFRILERKPLEERPVLRRRDGT
jgi:hypothetical protein